MRCFIVRRKPTPSEVTAISAEVYDGALIQRPGEFIVTFDERHQPPRWLQGEKEFSIPGEPDRCPHCGELLGEVSTGPGPGGIG